ncbi:MAG: AAA family ATPase [Acidobacteria bacterium]|nr:AAA family ATPase [Acidobacteriota bacterium]
MRVLLAGLPGTGKSTLAAALAARQPALVLSKDTVRAAVFGPQWVEYSSEQDEFVMGLLLETARWWEARKPDAVIIFDGRTFAHRWQRDAVQADRVIWCVCPPELARQRLEAATGHPAADRGVALYERVEARFEPLTEPHLLVDTSRPLAECVEAMVAYLR